MIERRMMTKLEMLCLTVGVLLTACLGGPSTAQTPIRTLPDRWVYLATDLQQDGDVAKDEALMQRAARAGYTGIVLSDGRLTSLGTAPPNYFRNVRQIQAVAKRLKLELIPSVFPIGYSYGILKHNPNLIEGFPVHDAAFVVHGGKADLAPDPDAKIANGGFEDAAGDKAAGWEVQDDPGRGSVIDHAVFHSGAASVRFDNVGQSDPAYGHGRIAQRIRLKPHRYYRLSFWVKTQNLDVPENVKAMVLPDRPDARNLTYLNLGVQRTQNWTLHQVLFNSQDATDATAYVGIWDGKGGSFWIDDVALEEVGLVNLIRRGGCPFTVRGQDGTVYKEGRDFLPVRDDKLPLFELYHTPPSIVLMPHSRIKDGQTLWVSFYHPSFIYDMFATCCLTEPEVYTILRDQMQRVEKLFHPTAVFMQHDEIRVANWCALCQAQKKTPGQLLADNVRRCIEIVKHISPKARIYVWSDMFDPYHNAKDNYYLVNGTWAGSWKGLTPEVAIVDWYFEKRKQDLPWFAAGGHHQILAGFYDGDVNQTATWLKDSRGVRGIDGVMYTTWQDDYSKLEDFAHAVWGGR